MVRDLCLSSCSYLISDLESQSTYICRAYVSQSSSISVDGFMNSTWKFWKCKFNFSWNSAAKSNLQPNLIFICQREKIGLVIILHHTTCCCRRDFWIDIGIWAHLHCLCPFSDQILEALARNDDTLVQMCGRLSSSCDVIPEELQVRFSAMCGDRVEHINRRITNYRKVTIPSCSADSWRDLSSASLFRMIFPSTMSCISIFSHSLKLTLSSAILCRLTIIETGCSWCRKTTFT